ncbi:ABC transporter ATP-binding protein [Mycetocola spongiae]|uniref:ABC transporter ATP-binding protein n=1 Tax=Mycetocola spongiae TaxID=2859226 RepID=UPI001CF430AB|nr:ATP-binding cassette domain-containing protein [Mycetocola spongiae]
MINPGSAPVPAAVEARGWGWRHASRLAWAVDNLTLRINPGERVLLLGASGAGKSTFMHALAGVVGGDDEGESHGTLTVDGVPPASLRGRSGLVLQDPDSQMILARVGDDVAFGCENLGVPREQIWPRVSRALGDVGLDLPLDHLSSRLSGGQKQRLALAGVLAMNPGLILLDEPTANLDPAGVREVRDAVGRALDRTGATLIVIEHRVSTWLPIVDRVIVLGPGAGVIADGDPATVLRERGAELAAAGVWVPEHPPVLAPRPPTIAGEVLLSGRGLRAARIPGTPVTRALDLDLRAGEILALTGPNGAGKSTLALTLAGLIRPEAGTLAASPALAQGAGPAPIGWKSRQLLGRIGSVFQDPEHQFLSTTVRGELEISPRMLRWDAEHTEARITEILGRLRLTALARAHPFTLSGGEKRRLSVATALVAAPAVLMLDEPTFGQDALTWAELVALVDELRSGGTSVLAVSHDEDFIAALADRELVLAAPNGGTQA